MQIDFHGLSIQYQQYKTEISLAIEKVLQANQFILGEEVLEFETMLGSYLGCKNVISCANGTDALLLALLALDIKAGDEVITTPFSFIAAAEVITLLGAVPVFVDIEADTYNIDANKIENKITHKTRAIVPVSLFGQPADMDLINLLAENFSKQFAKKIYVIEDAAQSLGATYQGKHSGNLSDIACLSFFPTKPLGCYGDGGAVVVNEDILAEKIKSLRVHGQTKRYEHKYIGTNSRLDTLQAAILKVKLRYLADEIKNRQRVANYYCQLLQEHDVVLPTIKPDRTSVYAQFSIKVKERKHIIDCLKNKNIPTAIHYPAPLHLQKCFAGFKYAAGDFPIAEQTTNQIMSLPMSAFLTEAQQNYISNSLIEIIESEPVSQVS